MAQTIKINNMMSFVYLAFYFICHLTTMMPFEFEIIC